MAAATLSSEPGCSARSCSWGCTGAAARPTDDNGSTPTVFSTPYEHSAPPPSPRRPAIFVDRDGTVIDEVGWLGRENVSKLRLLPGAEVGLRALSKAGYALVMVTNQSAVARGLIDEADVHHVHVALTRKLRAREVHLDAIYYCPHHPDPAQARVSDYCRPCACRKPGAGMALRAADELNIELSRSWVIGDQATDMGLARALGCRGALVLTGHGTATLASLGSEITPFVVCQGLGEAAQHIIERGRWASPPREGIDDPEAARLAP